MVCGWQTLGNRIVSYWTDTYVPISEIRITNIGKCKRNVIWHPVIVHVAEINPNEFDADDRNLGFDSI